MSEKGSVQKTARRDSNQGRTREAFGKHQKDRRSGESEKKHIPKERTQPALSTISWTTASMDKSDTNTSVRADRLLYCSVQCPQIRLELNLHAPSPSGQQAPETQYHLLPKPKRRVVEVEGHLSLLVTGHDDACKWCRCETRTAVKGMHFSVHCLGGTMPQRLPQHWIQHCARTFGCPARRRQKLRPCPKTTTRRRRTVEQDTTREITTSLCQFLLDREDDKHHPQGRGRKQHHPKEEEEEGSTTNGRRRRPSTTPGKADKVKAIPPKWRREDHPFTSILPSIVFALSWVYFI